MEFFSPIDIPKDEANPQYCISFLPGELDESMKFFDFYGMMNVLHKVDLITCTIRFCGK